MMPKGGMRREQITREIRAGKNNFQIGESTGAHRATIRKLRRELEDKRGYVFMCQGCERPANHRGVCASRPRGKRKPFRKVLDSKRTIRAFQALGAGSAIAK